ncbi:MAG: glycogen debranching protein GlgX [Pseudomonadota bacterium]
MTLRPESLAGALAWVSVAAGRPYPMGATVTGDGVNFAVFSAHAQAVDLCLFSPDGIRETARIALPERDGDIWHGYVAGLEAGQLYGFRVHGPYQPALGQRFNPNKLLIDPYAKAWSGRLIWADEVLGYQADSVDGDLSFAVPKSVVVEESHLPAMPTGPRRPLSDSVIYEAHVKGLTMRHPAVPAALRGTYGGVGHPAVIDHLVKLGVTAVELLPVQGFFDDKVLADKALRNYWGYHTMGFFTPAARYAAGSPRAEFRAMVAALHAADIEVILDVVYNHTGEGDEIGPTLSFRGFDNESYYRLTEGGRRYANWSGTGNTVNLSHPMVLRLVSDSLRHWVTDFGIDGFRFDLAPILGRQDPDFAAGSAFFAALRQDPVLAGVKLIAEPWDIGPDGYQLGRFPHPFAEWNAQFRDGLRRYWRGDAGMSGDLAKRLLGSAEQFDWGRRAATSSVNFITAHDGFTLQDLVSFTTKRNLANGEDNRDGHSDNHSDNLGAEGPSTDPRINAARNQRKRNLLATLMLSQGTPMLLAGDEIGHSQGGNNNAYAQDNDTTWIDWAKADGDLAAFVARLTALRAAHPVLRQRQFLHGRYRAGAAVPDVLWHRADGARPDAYDWHDPAFRCLCVELRAAAEGPDLPDVIFAVFNAGPEQALSLPKSQANWQLILDTSCPTAAPCLAQSGLTAPANAVLVFTAAPEGVLL